MKLGTIYDKRSGRVIMTVAAPDEECVRLQITDEGEQEVILDVELNGKVQYVVNGVVVDRPKMNLALNEGELAEDATINLGIGETFVVSGIPKGTVLHHPGGKLTIDDGYADWSTSEVGNYLFRFENFPYQEETIHAIVG